MEHISWYKFTLLKKSSKPIPKSCILLYVLAHACRDSSTTVPVIGELFPKSEKNEKLTKKGQKMVHFRTELNLNHIRPSRGQWEFAIYAFISEETGINTFL